MAERRDNAITAFTVGRVQNDPELKTSAKDVPYLQLTLMEKLGFGERTRTQLIQVWAWGNLARQLCGAGVKKGSQIWVSGSLELTDCVRRNGTARDKVLKLMLREWGQTGSENMAEHAFHGSAGLGQTGVIDGDRESLPD